MSCRAQWGRAGHALGVPIALCRRWRRSSAGVTSTIPTRDFAIPLSISRSNGVPRPTSFSLNQTETPSDSSRSCSSLAAYAVFASEPRPYVHCHQLGY